MSKKKWKKQTAKKSADIAVGAGKPSPKKTSTANTAQFAAQPSSIQRRVAELEGQVGRIAQVLSLLDKKISPMVAAFKEASTKAKQQTEKPGPSEGQPLYDPKHARNTPQPKPEISRPPPTEGSGGMIEEAIAALLSNPDALGKILGGTGESSSESPFEAEMLKGFREMYVKSFTDFVSRQDTLRKIGEEVLTQIAKGKIKFELETKTG